MMTPETERYPSSTHTGFDPMRPNTGSRGCGCLGGLFGLGCLLPLLATVGFLAYGVYALSDALRPQLEVFETWVEGCPEAAEFMGEPIEIGLTNLRNFNLKGGPTEGVATVHVTVGGRKNGASLHTVLDGRDGVWLPQRAELSVEGKTIDLMVCSDLKSHKEQQAWPKDPEALGPELERACHGGDPQACLVLAGFLMHHQQPARAALLYDEACESGYDPACTLVTLIKDKTP
jgi:hypothetical protein